jgi:hypothetical protein
MMHWTRPSQIIYVDTDSVKILYDKTNPNHKYPIIKKQQNYPKTIYNFFKHR